MPVSILNGVALPLCSMTATEGEIWLALIEKACAKVFQGYSELAQLHVLEILKTFTPTPQMFLNHDRVHPEDVWKQVIEQTGGSMVFASSGTEQSKESAHTNGAMLFAIVKALEVYDSYSGKKEKILKIRDMGEKLDWTGDWSASSGKWSP